MLTQAARAWAKSGRPQVAFGEPSKGIELYLVPPGPLAAALLATAAQAAPDSNGPRVPPAGTLVAVLVHRKDFAPPEWWNKEAPGAAHAGPVPPSSGPTPSASLPPVPSAATLRAPHDPRRAGLPSAAAGQAQSDAALPALTSGNTLAMLQAALLGPAPPTSGPHPPAPVGGASMGSTGLNGNGVSAGAWQRGTPAQVRMAGRRGELLQHVDFGSCDPSLHPCMMLGKRRSHRCASRCCLRTVSRPHRRTRPCNRTGTRV